MNFKKIGLFFVMFFVALTSINAVEYLNECGKDSGWVNGETYILNFTEVPATFSGYCLRFDDNKNYQDITIKGINSIDVKTAIDFNFFYFGSVTSTDATYYKDNITFEDLEFFSSTDTKIDRFFYARSYYRTDNYIDNLKLTNVTLDLKVNNFFFMYSYYTSSGTAGNVRIQNGVFTDVVALDVSTLLYQTGVINPSYFNGNNLFYYNAFVDSLIIAEIQNQEVGEARTVYNMRQTGNTIDDSVFSLKDRHTMFTNTNSIIDGYPFPDGVTGDNIAESTNLQHITPKLSIQKLGFNFIQDVENGFDYTGINEKIVSINKEDLGLNGLIIGANDNQIIEFLNEINLINRVAINMRTSGQVDCSIFTPEKCVLTDLNYEGITTHDYRGLITTNPNNKINNVHIEKVNNLNNAHLISNPIDILYNNIEISNSQISRIDNRVKNLDEHLIKFRYNSIDIHDNIFTMGGATSTNYELFYIQGDKNSNKIYNNVFESSLSTIHGTELFTVSCDTQFYNNKVSSQYTISNSCLDVELNPTISYYNDDDDMIYYFQVGNYYDDYSVTCLDSDSNGFCDVPHTLGSYTDNFTLSEYPFDWKSQLFNAVDVVDNSNFNITIYVPEAQNLIYELSSATDNLEFSFKHDSTFLDLSCDYIINGEPLSHISEVNNSIQTIFLNGFDEGYYSFYVECYNDYRYKNSDLYSFFVNYEGGEAPPTNYTPSEPVEEPPEENSIVDMGGVNIGTDFKLGIMGGNTQETSDNLLGFMSVVETPLGYFFIFAMVVLVLAFVGLLFSFLRFMVR